MPTEMRRKERRIVTMNRKEPRRRIRNNQNLNLNQNLKAKIKKR